MADEQVSFSSVIFIILLGGFIIRYLFFSSPAASSAANQDRNAAANSRAREAAVERIQQVFPQLDRRTILWELQRSGGNITATTDRVLTGRIETPPTSFQPPPPPVSSTPTSTAQVTKSPVRPAEPDLITRYKLQSKLSEDGTSETVSESVEAGTKKKAWSSNRDERQAAFQRRRDEMILAARRRMEAKLAAEK